MKNITYTDWTSYYAKPKSIISERTQDITFNNMKKLIVKYRGGVDRLRIIECGGGNSCFATKISEFLDVEY